MSIGTDTIENIPWDDGSVGTTFPAQLYTGTIESGVNTTLARVQVDITLSGASTPALQLDSDTSGVTIITASTWSYRIDAINPLSLAAGTYYYTIKGTDSSDYVYKLGEGSWKIT